MKLRKAGLATLLIVTMVFPLTACFNASNKSGSSAEPTISEPVTTTPSEQSSEEITKEALIGNWQLSHDRGYEIQTNVFLILRGDGTFTKYLFTAKTWERDRYQGNWQFKNGNLVLHYTSKSQYDSATKSRTDIPFEEIETWTDCSVSENQIVRGSASGDSKAQIRYDRFDDEQLKADVFQGYD